MTLKLNQKKGFTLIEILVVVIVIGILASIALVRYDRTLFHTRENDAVIQLKLIHAANVQYHSRQGYYMPAGTGDLAAINQALVLNIMANDLFYQYTFVEKDGIPGPSAQDGYEVTAAFLDSQGNPFFRLKVTDASLSERPGSENPCCDTSGKCLLVPDC